MVAESIDHLTQQVERAATVNAAVIVVLNDMRDRLEELAKHPDAAKIRELAQQLSTHTDKLAHAISEHEE